MSRFVEYFLFPPRRLAAVGLMVVLPIGMLGDPGSPITHVPFRTDVKKTLPIGTLPLLEVHLAGGMRPTAPCLLLWPDGTMIWNEDFLDRDKIRRPDSRDTEKSMYRQGSVPPGRLEEVLARLRAGNLLEAPRDEMPVRVEQVLMIYTFLLDGGRHSLVTIFPLYEGSSDEFPTMDGIRKLEGASREEVIAAQPESFRERHRQYQVLDAVACDLIRQGATPETILDIGPLEFDAVRVDTIGMKKLDSPPATCTTTDPTPTPGE